MTPLEMFIAQCAVSLVGDRIGLKASRRDLGPLFASSGYSRGAEIGVWEGSYAEHLCQTIPGLTLTCVDPWRPMKDYHERKNDAARLERAYQITQERLKSYDCTFLRMTSLEAVQRIPDGSLDFVYIDGNHSKASVLADLRAWSPKVRSGGIVAGHDYRSDDRKAFIEVKDAVDQFTFERGIAPVYLLTADKSPSFFWVVA